VVDAVEVPWKLVIWAELWQEVCESCSVLDVRFGLEDLVVERLCLMLLSKVVIGMLVLKMQVKIFQSEIFENNYLGYGMHELELAENRTKYFWGL
jgi:hypothetical protein